MSHPIGFIPDPYSPVTIRQPTIDELADTVVLRRCAECFKLHDGEWAFCSDACEEVSARRTLNGEKPAVFEERLHRDHRPVCDNIHCYSGCWCGKGMP
jgi:hypothetical protein